MSPLLAHGLGDAGDLPVAFPVVLFLAAGAVLLTAALVERGDPARAPAGRRLPRLTAVTDHPTTRAVLRGLALAGFAVVVLTATFGPAPASANPAPRTLFVLFWGLLVPVSLLLGPVWRVANPLRTLATGLARLSGDPEGRTTRPLPPGIGVWPAAVQLGVFVWAERNAAGSAGSVLLLVLGLTVVQLLAAARYGPDWFRHGDPFEVVAELVGGIAPLGRGEDGVLVLRAPRVAARGVPAGAGVPVVLAVLSAGHLSDFVLDNPLWHTWRATLGTIGQVALDTVTLVGVLAVAVPAAAALARRTPSLLPALVPVATGYALAHHAGVLLVEGQFAVIQLSDPLGRGWDLLGMTGRFVPLEPVPAGIVAGFVVLALIVGHVAAVRIGWDAAHRRYTGRAAVAAQLPLRLLLVISVVAAVGFRLSVE